MIIVPRRSFTGNIQNGSRKKGILHIIINHTKKLDTSLKEILTGITEDLRTALHSSLLTTILTNLRT